ncbi:MAG TPA: alpha/beta fold hydrolase [Anaerolineae bacterium]|nr:alpha/beta fold hydrolase [Anaerolineae bacterium]
MMTELLLARRLSYGGDPNHFGDLYLPAGPGPHPLVVFIHGGYWRARYDLEHAGPLCQALAQAGVAVWNVEYRRVGNPGGGWPGTFADVLAALGHVRQLALNYPLDLERVTLMGHSAGGHLALWAAAARRIPGDHSLHDADPLPLRRVVALAAVSDLRRAWELHLSSGAVAELLGGGPQQAPEAYALASPIELLPLDVPQILLHGDADEAVPYELSQRFHAAARAAGDDCALVTLPNTGHFELIDPRSAAWPHVLTTLLG